MHLFCGAWGVLAVGFFATETSTQLAYGYANDWRVAARCSRPLARRSRRAGSSPHLMPRHGAGVCFMEAAASS